MIRVLALQFFQNQGIMKTQIVCEVTKIVPLEDLEHLV